ncbi:MAG TPA: hypothetical protein VD766_13190, partial [Solirubrobacterales bacterium]|nr:hypothetical protein [Solirubrobacterales bacterium]
MVSEIERVADRLGGLADRWNGRSRRLVSVTREVQLTDPVAAIAASRLASDRWFAWEEPDRGFALAGLGTAAETVSRGPGRFADVSADCAAILRDRIYDEPIGLPAGAGPVWTGGFAFAEDGGASAHWSSLPPALLVLPEISFAREHGRTFLTAA